MSLWENIYASLRACLPAEVPVIRRDQNGDLPTRTFVTAKVTSDVREGHAAVGLPDAGGIVTIQQGSLLSISIDSFGPDAWEMAQALVNGMNRLTVQDVLRDHGFAYVRHLKGPEDISWIRGTGFEQRVHQDIQLRCNVVISDDIGIIEHVEISGLINDTLEFKDMVSIGDAIPRAESILASSYVGKPGVVGPDIEEADARSIYAEGRTEIPAVTALLIAMGLQSEAIVGSPRVEEGDHISLLDVEAEPVVGSPGVSGNSGGSSIVAEPQVEEPGVEGIVPAEGISAEAESGEPSVEGIIGSGSVAAEAQAGEPGVEGLVGSEGIEAEAQVSSPMVTGSVQADEVLAEGSVGDPAVTGLSGAEDVSAEAFTEAPGTTGLTAGDSTASEATVGSPAVTGLIVASGVESEAQIGVPAVSQESAPAISGGTPAPAGYTGCTFDADGTLTVSGGSITVNYELVAGGASGGSVRGGGGGAGEIKRGSMLLSPGTYSVIIGAGGISVANSNGINGGDTIALGLIAAGGGYGGGSFTPNEGGAGGSGGGGGGNATTGTAGKAGGSSTASGGGLGNRGGAGNGNSVATNRTGGGGGGANGVGGEASNGVAGSKGPGSPSACPWVSATYSTGGRGGVSTSTPGVAANPGDGGDGEYSSGNSGAGHNGIAHFWP